MRPESVVLHQKRPAHTENILEGKVGAAMFLGEYLDCTLEIGKNVMQTHQHYTLQVRRGDPVWVKLQRGNAWPCPGRRLAPVGTIASRRFTGKSNEAQTSPNPLNASLDYPFISFC